MSKRRRLSANGEYKATHSNGTSEEVQTQQENDNETVKEQRRTLFVRSLPATVTTERLVEIFSQDHPIKHATVVQNPQSKTSKGYGFVTFVDAQDAQTVIKELNNTKVDGRNIKLELAEPRHRDLRDAGGEKNQASARAIEHKTTRTEEKAKNSTGGRLIIRNLPWTIKESEDLAIYFRSYGKVRQAIVPKIGTNTQAGFGIVVLRGRKNAEKAIEGLNGKVIDGRTLAVDWAVDKETWERMKNQEAAEHDLKESTSSKAERVHEATGSTSDGQDSFREDDARSEAEDDELEANSTPEDREELDLTSEADSEQPPTSTIFVRNVPFTMTDETFHAHFAQHGGIRYARIVVDSETERSKGTGFVCFFNEEDAKTCVKNAPKSQTSSVTASVAEDKKRKGKLAAVANSVLQNEMTDQTGLYTVEGRVLIVSRALSRSDASKREAEASSKRASREYDKRRLYLLSEGTIAKGSKLYEKLGQAEINIREASMKQRKRLFNSNPSLHVSLTRLSVRNIPRSMSSKQLKALAREAVVGFATDVRQGLRQPLAKDELKRSADEMQAAEKRRKAQGKGIVNQAKIVFEGKEGSKVEEKSGAGRSRGYGFIEYVSHRTALMGLRWLNGHPVSVGVSGERSIPNDDKRKKRLIVEFAIENAQVTSRRKARETKNRAGEGGQRRKRSKSSGKEAQEGGDDENDDGPTKQHTSHSKKNPSQTRLAKAAGEKRKRDEDQNNNGQSSLRPVSATGPAAIGSDEKNRIAKRNRIIAKKRGMRRKSAHGKAG